MTSRITSGQEAQIRMFAEAAVRKAVQESLTSLNLSLEEGQRVIENGGIFQSYLAEAVNIALTTLQISDLYSDQVVESRYSYLSGYNKARPVSLQIATLQQYEWGRKIDWRLNNAQHQLLRRSPPLGSEGYFVVVFHETMVMHYERNPGVDQSGAVTLALNALNKQRNNSLSNLCEDRLGPTYYRRNKRSAEMMRKLWESQDCPVGIILIPAQLGIEHRGKSVLRSRVVMSGSEFPLDAYEVVQMVLTHEHRLKHYDDLWLDIPGSEYSAIASSVFDGDSALALKFIDDVPKFGCFSVSSALDGSGSVSGFLPQ
jgi:hypothetical protein